MRKIVSHPSPLIKQTPFRSDPAQSKQLNETLVTGFPDTHLCLTYQQRALDDQVTTINGPEPTCRCQPWQLPVANNQPNLS